MPAPADTSQSHPGPSFLQNFPHLQCPLPRRLCLGPLCPSGLSCNTASSENWQETSRSPFLFCSDCKWISWLSPAGSMRNSTWVKTGLSFSSPPLAGAGPRFRRKCNNPGGHCSLPVSLVLLRSLCTELYISLSICTSFASVARLGMFWNLRVWTSAFTGAQRRCSRVEPPELSLIPVIQ